jgi:hypothetical protein
MPKRSVLGHQKRHFYGLQVFGMVTYPPKIKTEKVLGNLTKLPSYPYTLGHLNLKLIVGFDKTKTRRGQEWDRVRILLQDPPTTTNQLPIPL